MTEHQKSNRPDFPDEIRIVGLNTEKTRRDAGSKTLYHIYFELSGHPLPEWRSLFEREWRTISPAEGADIDGGFLVVHGQLSEVATIHFPALKKAVATTNEAYIRYAKKEATALEQRVDAWKQERKEVEDMAASLGFD